MKKQFTIYLIGAVLCFFSFTGCTKFDDLFNFENISGVEGTSSWGAPIINATYSIDDIIQRFDSSGYIQVAQDGSLSFIYTVEKDKIIKSSDFLSLDNKSFISDFIINSNTISNSVSIEHHTFPINFENDFLRILSANIKTGLLEIHISNNMEQNYYCKLTTSNIKTAGGQDFTITFSPSQTSHTIDLSNYSIIPGEDNAGIFDVEVGVNNNGIPPAQAHYNLNVNISLTDISIRSVYAQISSYPIPFNEVIDFDLSSTNYGGDVTIYNPKIFISTKNSFMMKGAVNIDTAAFSGDGLYSSIITNPPVAINIPISPNAFITEQVEAFSSINLNTEYNKISISGVAILNPDGFDAGVIRIDENSEISLKLKAEIPLDLKITNLYLKDTIDFDLNEIVKDIPMSDFQFIDTLALRAYFESTLPVNAYAQVYFVDTTSQEIVDSLFSNNKIIYGSFSGFPAPSPVQMFYLTGDRMEQIKGCHQIIFRFKMDTENNEVILNKRQYLKAAIGLKAVLNYNHLTINP